MRLSRSIQNVWLHVFLAWAMCCLLIEKAQANVDMEKAKELEEKFMTQSFTFDDFIEQLQAVKKMGPLDEILKMIARCK